METMKNMKPMSTKVRDTVLRIVERTMYYNNTPTKQEYTGDKPTFFVEFNGHCGDIDVHCYPKGYREGAGSVWCGGDSVHSLCEDEYETEEEILADLDRIIADMDRYYNDWFSRQEAAPDV